jgi:GTP-binding protein
MEDGSPCPFTAQLFSALKRTGLDEATDRIESLLGLNLPAPEQPAPAQSQAADDAEQA